MIRMYRLVYYNTFKLISGHLSTNATIMHLTNARLFFLPSSYKSPIQKKNRNSLNKFEPNLAKQLVFNSIQFKKLQTHGIELLYEYIVKQDVLQFNSIQFNSIQKLYSKMVTQ